MSKETAMNFATQQNPITSEVRVSPVTGPIPAAETPINPAVENGGVVPQSPHSAQLAHFAKKEQKFLAEREVFKKEQEEVRVLKTKLEEVYNKAQNFESTRKTDPIKAMKELGFTEQEIIDYLSQDEAPKLSTEEIVQAELKKYKDEESKKLEETQKLRDQDLITKFKGQLSATVAADPEKYEACAIEGPVAESLMYDIAVIEAKEGKVPDPKSIADDVEEYFVSLYRERSKLKKLSPKEEAAIESSKPLERTKVVHPSQDMVVQKPKITTLTNKVAATSAALAKPVDRAETREEKRARLESILRNGVSR